MMMSCEQQIHEAQALKETESSEETREQQWKKVIELINNRTEYHVNMKFTLQMAGTLQTKRELQTKPRQQDEFQKEIQAATELQQSSDDQLKHHRTLQEGVLRGLPMTTTTVTSDFQRFIRVEKDEQHVYTQDQDWTTIKECMMEIKSLASRQTRLGELEQIESEKYLDCGQQIRAINHIMNVSKSMMSKMYKNKSNLINKSRHIHNNKRHENP